MKRFRLLPLLMALTLAMGSLSACDSPKDEIVCTYTTDGLGYGSDKRATHDEKDGWESHRTHFVNKNNIDLSMTWDSPADIGDFYKVNETALVLVDSARNYIVELEACKYSYYDYYAELTQEQWTSRSKIIPYVDGGAFNKDVSGDVIRVSFPIHEENFYGYFLVIVDRSKSICYEFIYCEEEKIYDEATVLEVINSVSY